MQREDLLWDLACQFLIGKVQLSNGTDFISMFEHCNSCQFLIGKVQRKSSMPVYDGYLVMCSCQFLIGKVQLEDEYEAVTQAECVNFS